MYRFARLVLAITPLALLLVPGSPALGQDAATTAGEQISFPFNPPLDQPMRYRVAKATVGTFALPGVELEQELTFHLAEGGYLLEIKTSKVVKAGRTYTPQNLDAIALGAGESIALAALITLRLSPSGHVTAVDNWDEVKATIGALPDRVAAQLPPAQRQRVREMIAGGVRQMMQTSDRGAIAFIASEWQPMLSYGLAQFELGKAATTRSQYNLFDAAVPVSAVHNVLVERAADGGLTLTDTQETDMEEFQAAQRQLMEQARASAPPELIAAREADLARMTGYHREGTTHLKVDQFGILESGFWEVRMERDGNVGESTKVTFERHD